MCLDVPLNPLKDVRVGLPLPLRQLVPVGHIRRFRVRNVLVDLGDPAQGHEPALLLTAELGRVAGRQLDERPDLLVYRRRALALPVRRVVPRRDVARLRLTGVVLLDARDQRFPKDPALLHRHARLLVRHPRAPTSTGICSWSWRTRGSFASSAKWGRNPASLRPIYPEPVCRASSRASVAYVTICSTSRCCAPVTARSARMAPRRRTETVWPSAAVRAPSARSGRPSST